MITVLAKVYPGTGRPDTIELVDTNDEAEINRLVNNHGYRYVAQRPDNYTVHDAWNEFTLRDRDGFIQWRKM